MVGFLREGLPGRLSRGSRAAFDGPCRRRRLKPSSLPRTTVNLDYWSLGRELLCSTASFTALMLFVHARATPRGDHLHPALRAVLRQLLPSVTDQAMTGRPDWLKHTPFPTSGCMVALFAFRRTSYSSPHE